MAGYVILGVFAAFGVLCALWALWGLILPGARGGVLLCLCRDRQEEAVLRRYFWLRDLGLLRCCLVLVDSELPPQRQQQICSRCPQVYFYTFSQWMELLEQECRNRG